MVPGLCACTVRSMIYVLGARKEHVRWARSGTCSNIQERSHFKGQHSFAKIRDSRSLTPEKARQYREAVWNEQDSFAFHTWNKSKLEHSKEALELVKRMLRQENEYRLGEEYQILYAKAQDDDGKVIGFCHFSLIDRPLWRKPFKKE